MAIIKKYFPSFTMRKSIGCWQGTTEETLEVVMYLLNLIFKDLEDCIDELKVELKQDAVGCEIVHNVDFKTR